MPEDARIFGDIVTGYDGARWYNQVSGSDVAANYRATGIEAEMKGREMARRRHVDHIVLDQDGSVVSQTRY